MCRLRVLRGMQTDGLNFLVCTMKIVGLDNSPSQDVLKDIGPEEKKEQVNKQVWINDSQNCD